MTNIVSGSTLTHIITQHLAANVETSFGFGSSESLFSNKMEWCDLNLITITMKWEGEKKMICFLFQTSIFVFSCEFWRIYQGMWWAVCLVVFLRLDVETWNLSHHCEVINMVGFQTCFSKMFKLSTLNFRQSIAKHQNPHGELSTKSTN